jgi:hypothetical protein
LNVYTSRDRSRRRRYNKLILIIAITILEKTVAIALLAVTVNIVAEVYSAHLMIHNLVQKLLQYVDEVVNLFSGMCAASLVSFQIFSYKLD